MFVFCIQIPGWPKLLIWITVISVLVVPVRVLELSYPYHLSQVSLLHPTYDLQYFVDRCAL